MPKHPTNSFLLTRIVKQNQHQQERITEIIGLIWLESVNKRSDEEMAILSIEWACEKWGIDPHEVTVNPDTTYPDGWARTVSGSVNIEVTKVQPRWPSKATLGALTAGTQVGKPQIR